MIQRRGDHDWPLLWTAVERRDDKPESDVENDDESDDDSDVESLTGDDDSHQTTATLPAPTPPIAAPLATGGSLAPPAGPPGIPPPSPPTLTSVISTPSSSSLAQPTGPPQTFAPTSATSTAVSSEGPAASSFIVTSIPPATALSSIGAALGTQAPLASAVAQTSSATHPSGAQSSSGKFDQNLSPDTEALPSTGARAGIIAGTVVAGVALLALMLFLLRRRIRMRRGPGGAHEGPPESSPWWRGSFRSRPPPTTHAATGAIGQTHSQILDELITSAYAMEAGGAPHDFVADEKHRSWERGNGLPDAGVEQPSIRSSLSRWFRETHPLRLSPLSRRSSTTTATTQPGASLAAPPRAWASRWSDTTQSSFPWFRSTQSGVSEGPVSSLNTRSHSRASVGQEHPSTAASGLSRSASSNSTG